MSGPMTKELIRRRAVQRGAKARAEMTDVEGEVALDHIIEVNEMRFRRGERPFSLSDLDDF